MPEYTCVEKWCIKTSFNKMVVEQCNAGQVILLQCHFCFFPQSHIGTNYIERSELERIKNELETKSRVELNAKLEEVNNYLEEQALARQRLDSMRDSNESEMRKDFEKTRKDMMVCIHFLYRKYKHTLKKIRDIKCSNQGYLTILRLLSVMWRYLIMPTPTGKY